MATIKSFMEIQVWQMASDLSKEIYFKTLEGTFSKDYSIRGISVKFKNQRAKIY